MAVGIRFDRLDRDAVLAQKIYDVAPAIGLPVLDRDKENVVDCHRHRVW